MADLSTEQLQKAAQFLDRPTPPQQRIQLSRLNKAAIAGAAVITGVVGAQYFPDGSPKYEEISADAVFHTRVKTLDTDQGPVQPILRSEPSVNAKRFDLSLFTQGQYNLNSLDCTLVEGGTYTIDPNDAKLQESVKKTQETWGFSATPMNRFWDYKKGDTEAGVWCEATATSPLPDSKPIKIFFAPTFGENKGLVTPPLKK